MINRKLEREAKLIVFTAPSGAGKTTIVRHLLGRFNQLEFSISATTRAKRAHETDGKDYYFVSETSFKEKIDKGEFAEWEEVYPGQFYGTLKSEIERLTKGGKCILFDIDVHGALRLKKGYRENCMTVFVKPPSLEALMIRLKKRNTETLETLKKRVDKASLEINYENRFDKVLINDNLDEALKSAEEIVKSFLKLYF